MTEEIILDTHVEESLAGDEVEMLLFALNRSRAQFAWKVGGLDAAALNRPHPPSAMTLGGLIKHLAWVEDEVAAWRICGQAPASPPWDLKTLMADPDWVWRSAAEDTPEQLYALYRGAVERNRALVAKVLADGGLDQPAKMPVEGEQPNVRRFLVDLHEEYARHVGHADLMREAIDGLVGEDPPQ